MNSQNFALADGSNRGPLHYAEVSQVELTDMSSCALALTSVW